MKILARIGIGILLILLLGTLTAGAQTYPVTFAERDTILNEHNTFRTLVGSPPLTWSGSLEQDALACAPIQGASHQITHICVRDKSKEGENLAWNSGGGPLGWKDVINNQWGSEKSNFIYAPFGNAASKTGDWKDIGHYTQMVWSDTKQIGCGKADHPDYGYVFVCRYSPPGNYPNQYPYPQPPPPPPPKPILRLKCIKCTNPNPSDWRTPPWLFDYLRRLYASRIGIPCCSSES